VPQLALVAAAAGPDRAVHCQSLSVKCSGSDHDDERIAMFLCAAHARMAPLVLAAIESEWPESPLPQA
jgi:hypothetical protein